MSDFVKEDILDIPGVVQWLIGVRLTNSPAEDVRQ